MAEPTLAEVFGANATQDATTLTIDKTDLAAVGLTASATNNAEGLFAAIVKQARTKLNATNQEADPDIQVTISDPTQFTNVRNAVTYDQYNYTLALEVQAPPPDIDPDDL